MPELPEVETIVRELRELQLIGKKICAINVSWPRIVAHPLLHEFCSQLLNQQIVEIFRRGKYIVFILTSNTLLIHLRMTGKLRLTHENAVVSPHERLCLQLDDGRYLHYEDQRKFGKWTLLPDPKVAFIKLGIEPFSPDFTWRALKAMAAKSSQRIKPFLLNQKHVAGLGNIYVDEALWESKIHPLRKANTLNQPECIALHRAVLNVLTQGILHMGTSLGSKSANYFSVKGRRGGNQSHLNVFRREGSPCPRCHAAIIKIIVGQRGTHLCTSCQKF